MESQNALAGKDIVEKVIWDKDTFLKRYKHFKCFTEEDGRQNGVVQKRERKIKY